MSEDCGQVLQLSSTHKHFKEDITITNKIKVKKLPDGKIMIWVHCAGASKGIMLEGDNLKKFKMFIDKC